MATSISGPFSAPPSAASPSPSIPATPQPVQRAAPADTVKLSQSAQVLLLQQQGQSPAQIATNLSISIADVDSYLGIAVPVTAQQPAPVQSSPANVTS